LTTTLDKLDIKTCQKANQQSKQPPLLERTTTNTGERNNNNNNYAMTRPATSGIGIIEENNRANRHEQEEEDDDDDEHELPLRDQQPLVNTASASLMSSSVTPSLLTQGESLFWIVHCGLLLLCHRLDFHSAS